MDFLQAFQTMDAYHPFVSESYDPQSHEPQFHDTTKMEEQYNLYRIQPRPYMIDGYISPYPSNNWDTSSGILEYIEDNSRLPALETKMDPNRIFSSDIAALRALAADQSKIKRIFEKRLMESLTEKGKMGLTEEDVEAMQAVTSAGSSIASIIREQVNIRKNIAELRLKQAQQQNGGVGNAPTAAASGSGGVMGKAIMDRIFDLPMTTVSNDQLYNAEIVDENRATEIIDSIIPEVSAPIQFEPLNPTTFAVVGDTDDDVDFQTFAGTSNDVIEGYPTSAHAVKKVDRDAGIVIDDHDIEYPIKFKSDL